MNVKELFKTVSKSITILLAGGILSIVFLVCFFVLLAIIGYAGGFLMYVMEILIVSVFVATVLMFSLHFVFKIISDTKIRERLEIIIGLLIFIIAIFLVIRGLHEHGGFLQNFLYYLNDIRKDF